MDLTPEQMTANGNVLVDMLRRLGKAVRANVDEYDAWLRTLDEALGGNVEIDPTYWSSPEFAKQIRAHTEAISHLHTGSTDHRYLRDVLDASIDAVSGKAVSPATLRWT